MHEKIAFAARCPTAQDNVIRLAPTAREATKRARRAEARAALMLASPAIILGALLIVLPVIAVFGLSLTDFELGYEGFSFVGLKNYAELWNDRIFMISLKNTLIYTALVAPASVILGLGAALLIETQIKARSFFRTVYFLPVASLLVAMATVWQYLLHPTIGPVNALLRFVGIEGLNWLGGSATVLPSLALIGVWQSVGFAMVLFLAGLTAIPRDLYAAAAIDGAVSAWDRFRLVTWPLLAPTTLFVVVVSTINAVKVFETVLTLTQGGPNHASDVLLWNIYQEGFVYLRIGYASAMTVIFLTILTAVMLAKYRFLDRKVHYA